MITSIGIQVLVITALVMTLLLVCYTVYVRVRQSTFTEKRFNFVALWSCSVVVFIAIQGVLNIPIIESVLAEAGLSISPPDTMSKTIVAMIAVVYVLTVARWASSWNGLLSEEGHRAREQGALSFFVLDGAKETIRIIRRAPPCPIHREKSVQAPQLPPPLSELTFQEQVRDLLVGRSPELVIDDSGWIADGSCWHGTDTGLDQPVLVVCGLDEAEINLDRLAAVVTHRSKVGKGMRLIAVCNRFQDRAAFTATLAALSSALPEVYTFEELIVWAVPLARYRHEIERSIQEEHLPGADFPIADVFVPARAYETEDKGKRLTIKGKPFDLDSYVADWIANGSLRHLALLGTYGQGKSSAALALTFRLLCDRSFAARCQNRIPILIRLTGLSPKSSDPEALLGQWGYRLGLNGRALLALHRAGRTVLILDAFDEMANVADRADRFDHFAALWQFASNGAKVLFTGRPNFFLDDEELKRALGISEGVAVGPFCSALRIAPFESDQIAGTLRWMSAQKVQTFMQAVDRLPQIYEVARRPSLLFQVSRLWDEKRIDIGGDAVYSGTVIRAFVTYSLERQIQKQRTERASGRPDRQFIPLTLAELDYFTCGCAVAALSEGRNNSLPAPVLRATIARLLNALPQSGLPLSAGEGGALAMPLRERLADRPDPIEACVQAARTHGVIEHDPAKPGMYKFSHKSFAEALAAEVLVYRVLRLQGSSDLVWNALWPASLISQSAILLFSMDIAAATGHTADVRAGSTMMARLLRRYPLVGTVIYDVIIANLVIWDRMFVVVNEYSVVSIKFRDTMQATLSPVIRTRREQTREMIKPKAYVADLADVFVSSLEDAALLIESSTITFASTLAALSFASFLAIWLFVSEERSLWLLISLGMGVFFTGMLTSVILAHSKVLSPRGWMIIDAVKFCLAIEYAVAKPSTEVNGRVLQFAILDRLVKVAVSRASAGIGASAMGKD